MSLDDNQSPDHAQDDEQSWRWSTDTIPSASLSHNPHNQSTESSQSPVAHEITAETLSRLPGGHIPVDSRNASSIDGDFHERQVKSAQGKHLNAKHVAAITASMQQCSDIIDRGHSHVSPQAEMLVGLQMDMKANPPVGIPADICEALEPACPSDPPPASTILIDEQYDETEVEGPVEGSYARAFQLRSLETFQLGAGDAETMRREAAMDDAIFRPNVRFTRMMPFERHRDRESSDVISVRTQARKRKRETKIRIARG